MSKTCPKCGSAKPLEEFGKNKLSPDGLQCWCKTCCSLSNKEWRLANPEVAKECSKAYYNKNSASINERRREQHHLKMATDPTYREKKRKESRQQRYSNPGLRADVIFRARCKKYGTTPKEFMALLEVQKHKCAVCGDDISKSQDVDHCHKTGKIRGILCHPCNVLLGFSKDSSLRCFLAASYLQKFGS